MHLRDYQEMMPTADSEPEIREQAEPPSSAVIVSPDATPRDDEINNPSAVNDLAEMPGE